MDNNGLHQKRLFDIKRLVLFCGIVALLIIVYLIQGSRPDFQEKMLEHGINYNIWAFLGALFVSFLAYFWVDRISIQDQLKEKRLLEFLMIVFIGYLFTSYLLEKEMFPRADSGMVRWQINALIWIPVFGGVSAGIITMMRKSGAFSDGKKRIWLRRGIIVLSSIFSAALSYAPNIYADISGGVHHIDAYINSIINVMYHVPYSDRAQSVYGHYGIMYYPIVKIFGSNTYGIMLAVAIVTFVTVILAGLILDIVISNDYLFILSIVAMLRMAVVYRVRGNYFQVYPHRMLFPLIAILWVMIERKNKISPIKCFVVEIIIGVAAYVWNIETGVVCVATIVVVHVLNNWKWNIIAITKKIAYAVAVLILPFIASYGIVNFYNILCGGYRISMATYIYPLGAKNYMEDILLTDFQKPIFNYVFYIFVFCAASYPVAVKHFVKETEIEFTDLVLLATSVSGLLALIYFINRQAYMNVTISYLQLVILVALEAERYMNNTADRGRVSLCYLSLFMLCMFSVECVISVGQSIECRAHTVWETDSLNEDIEWFKEWRDGDAVAIGIGVPELYYYTGDDNYIHMTDAADFFDSFEYLRERLENEDSVIISEEFATKFEEKYDYYLVDKFEGNNITLFKYAR